MSDYIKYPNNNLPWYYDNRWGQRPAEYIPYDGPPGTSVGPYPCADGTSTTKSSIFSSFPIWTIAVGAILIFLISTEYGSQDCLDKYCNNQAPPISNADNAKTIIDKIIVSIRNEHRLVNWRRAMIAAIIVAIIIAVLCNFTGCSYYFPNGFTILYLSVILLFAYYFSASWLQSHWWKMNNDKEINSLLKLRARLNK